MRGLLAVASAGLLIAFPALARGGVEVWQAMSKTAMSITGTIRLSPTQLRVGKVVYPLRVAGDVKAYKADTGTYGARILEVTRPMDPPLIRGNRLCGSGPVQWLVVYRSGKEELGMSVFGKGPRPTGDDSPGLCGTYFYTR